MGDGGVLQDVGPDHGANFGGEIGENAEGTGRGEEISGMARV